MNYVWAAVQSHLRHERRGVRLGVLVFYYRGWTPDPAWLGEQRDIRKLLDELVARMPEGLRRVIVASYGLDGQEPQTLQALGEQLGQTGERVCQLQCEALVWLRTGFEMFTDVGQGGYVAEKAEGNTGWLFPVGDEVGALGYVSMFMDMFNAMDAGKPPMETFYDGYIVNAIIDACYKAAETKKWEPVEIQDWRGGGAAEAAGVALKDYDAEHYLIKEERMPNGNLKIILKHKRTGEISQIIKP